MRLRFPVHSDNPRLRTLADAVFTPTNDDHITTRKFITDGYVPYTGATGKVTFFTPTTTQASIRLPHGVTPTTLANGDMWTTVDAMFLRRGETTRIIPDTGHTLGNRYWRLNSANAPTYSVIVDDGTLVGVGEAVSNVNFNIIQDQVIGLRIANDSRTNAPSPVIITQFYNEEIIFEKVLFSLKNYFGSTLYNEIISIYDGLNNRGVFQFHTWDGTATQIAFQIGNGHISSIDSNLIHKFQAGVSIAGSVVMNSLVDKSADANYARVLVSNSTGVIAYANKAGFGMPTGTVNQTLRHNGTTWVASSSILNSDTIVSISGSSYVLFGRIDGHSITSNSLALVLGSENVNLPVYTHGTDLATGLVQRASDGKLSTIASSTFGNLSGTLTANYIPVATGANTVGNSIIYQDTVNSRIGFGITTPDAPVVFHNASNSMDAVFSSNYSTASSRRIANIDFRNDWIPTGGTVTEFTRMTFRRWSGTEGYRHQFVLTNRLTDNTFAQMLFYDYYSKEMSVGSNLNVASLSLYGGSQYAILNNTGFGIGVTPTEQLHTTGGVRFAGITEVAVAQQNPKVLVQDGNGKLFFQNLTSAGGFVNPMENVGDMIVGSTAGAAIKLAATTTVGTRMYLSQYKDQPTSDLHTTWEQIAYADISGTPNLTGTANYIPVKTATGWGDSLVYSNSAANATDSFIIQRKSDAFPVFKVDTISNSNYARIGINCDPDGAALHIRTFTLSGTGGAGTTLTQENISENAGGASLLFRKSRGYLTAQAPVNAGDVIGGMVATVYTGTTGNGYSGILTGIRFMVQDKQGESAPFTYSTYTQFLTTEAGVSTYTEKMRLAANGFLGINTTIPTERLHVVGAGLFTTKVITPAFEPVADSTTALQVLRKSDGFPVMSFDMTGNAFFGRIGINTTAPEAPVHIVAFTTDGSAPGSVIIQENISSGTTGAAITFRKSRGVPGALAAVVANDIAGGVVSQVYDGSIVRTVAAYRQIFSGPVGSEYRYGYHVWQTAEGAGVVERIRLISNGNLGINITTPAEKLHVVGNTRVDGNLGVGVAVADSPLHVLYSGTGNIGTFDFVGGTGIGSNFVFRKARGTVGSLAAAQAGDTGFDLASYFHNGTDYVGGAKIISKLTSISGSDVFGEIGFYTNNGTGVFAERMKLNSLGHLGVNVNPAELLHIKGGNFKVQHETNNKYMVLDRANLSLDWHRYDDDGATNDVVLGNQRYYGVVWDNENPPAVDELVQGAEFYFAKISPWDGREVGSSQFVWRMAVTDGTLKTRMRLINNQAQDNIFSLYDYSGTSQFSVQDNGAIITGNGNSAFVFKSATVADPGYANNEWILITIGGVNYQIAAKK